MMSSFPERERMERLIMNADQFYAQRDHRTNLGLEQPPEPVRLAIGLAPAWAETVEGQLTFLWLCSLVARMGRRYNQFRLLLPREAALAPSIIRSIPGSCLADSVLRHLHAADPFGGYAIVDSITDDSYVLSVGTPVDGLDGMVVRPNGWAASLTTGQTPSTPEQHRDPPNPVGPALAASLAAAEIYHHFNQERLPGYSSQAPLYLSAWERAASRDVRGAVWDNPPLPETIDIGRCLVVGLGALCDNSLAILGELVSLVGHIEGVESDIVDITNLNRLVAASVADVDALKVHITGRSLAGTGVRFTPHRRRYESLRESDTPLDPALFDIVMAGVDQMASRAFVQSDWPRLLIDAGTRGYTWRITRSPVNSDRACLGCLAGNAQRTFRDLHEPLACATGQPAQSVAAAKSMDSYSFVSFFGAAFLAAEALRQCVGLPDVSINGCSLEAGALNLKHLTSNGNAPSDRCLCLCSRPVVRAYRASKYDGGIA